MNRLATTDRRRESGAAWHALQAEVVLRRLETDADSGLSEDEHNRRAAKYGPNVLTRQRGRGPIVRFLLQFHSALVYILIGAAAVTASLGEWVDTAVILAVVIVNAIVGFVQESKALQAISALARTLSSEALVVRGGRRVRVSAESLTLGDIVLLTAGDKAPADMRLIHVSELDIDESALTGESLPVTKRAAALDELNSDQL